MTNGRFWSFVFQPLATAPGCCLLDTSGAGEDVPRPAAVVIEILNQGPLWTIVISVADSLEPLKLHCIFAVSNRTNECNKLAMLGFPIVEGDITRVDNTLLVNTAFYPRRQPGKPSELTTGDLLKVSTEAWDTPLESVLSSSGSNLRAFDPPYFTLQCAPDLACPDSQLKGLNRKVSPGRQNMQGVDRSAHVELKDVLYPDLHASLGNVNDSHATWIGHYTDWHPEEKVDPPTRFPRRSVFGPPSYRFDDIELVGFRAPLRISKLLTESLNFHQAAPGRNMPKHFRYRAAAPKVAIEMLRYGRMRGVDVPPPFRDDDFMPQHELLARLVVGRVDDDTSQARDAALFVPAIFVDNPWSKAVGRQLQGFPKMLAEFRDERGTVGMNDPAPLHTITEVHLAGVDPGPSTRLLSIDCPDAKDGSVDEFVAPDVTTFLTNIAARRSPWKQFDFLQGEFRRTFARFVLGQRFGGFRVIQVSPVDATPLPKAWIPGRYTLSDVRVAFPSGIATLRLENPPTAPEGWKHLFNSLLDEPGQLAFATGDWYRVKCSMELEFDDGLEW